MVKFIKNTSIILVIGMVLIVSSNDLNSQSGYAPDFVSPLKIPLLLSGNYGELRSAHFHAGIDIKTLGKIGQPVYAAEAGYISRIKIQSGGYGCSIYITHPTGYKTVYAHLDRFNSEIQTYVKQSQYKLQKFEVDLYPPRNKFSLLRGQQFAVSGNTGRSGGPHLHFEIREAKNEVPLNVLKFNFPIVDNLSPEFRNLYVYTFPENSITGNNGEFRKNYTVTRENDTLFYIDEVIELQNEFCGFGTEVYDFLNGSSNRCGIYSLELIVDDKSLFSFAIDNISFLKTRYINAHMDYELKTSEGRSVHRLFRLPNNRLPIYSGNNSENLLHLKEDSLYHGRILAKDAYGNVSYMDFKFRKKGEIVPVEKKDATKLVRWNEGNEFAINGNNVRIPSGALYRDIYFDYREIESNSEWSDTICIHHESEPLQKNIMIKITPDRIPFQLKSKMLIARIDEDELSFEGADWQNSQLTAKSRDFGKYIVAVDTVSPEIVPVNFTENRKYLDGESIVFKVVDQLSGIKSYNAFLNEKWALLEYDAKSDLMIYRIDKDELKSGLTYSIKLQVVDRMNNIAIFESQFVY